MRPKKVSVPCLLTAVALMPFAALHHAPGGASRPLSSQEVYHNDFVRNTFYTWTTAGQIEELGRTKVLLSKSRSETKGLSLFDASLEDPLLKDDPIATLLREERFARKRFAWTNAWATVMGWKGETYGDHLIRIVLSDSSIIGKFDTWDMWREEPFSFFDMKGQKLTIAHVLEHKDRIAAIYHVNDYKGERRGGGAGTYHRGTRKKASAWIPFREYVIINERMIEDWSHGTQAIRDELASEIDLLERYQRSDEANQKAYGREDGWRWLTAEREGDLMRYRASKCIENDHYLFDPKRLRAIANKLRAAIPLQSPETTK